MDRSDKDELAAFCAREYRRLVGSLTLYCGDATLATELAHEALARACANWPKVREMQAPGAWVHRVALNQANSLFRRRRTERTAMARYGGLRQVGEDVVEPVDVLTIRRAVAALPPRQRTALVLRYYSDLSVDDTAQAMNCQPGTVKSLTSRAIAALRASGLTDFRESTHA